ncbi:GMC family oxidoreductase [Pusillimonas noertemannii]|uniref:Choline dehydrogenase/4-pyridoxate dehydrogenase n=1 Tax=Pusillimonas noertemannii TaxID=305977 RepID=A0A2U1CR48_9BURK|nr:choline dehydrogenase [Pusillimonas noertemannii]NYT67599.1 choline dehydrogenase [Pusillimonas noertemannii]PVY68271.1 choline dehydrogenase/4-pyridoxate dehydrogenase [Pusillimonas noertemannii]TFL12235.1 choline dehydrogenase [Pusillimonas noertemannii]
MSRSEAYEYIIIGAGSAGSTLANRLSEGGASVLVIEAGGSDRSPLISVPLGWGRIFPRRLFDWGYFAEPEKNLDGRRIECARGKVLGGSSSINVMAYVRGHSADYDRWAASGLAGWGYRDVLPYFKRSEDWAGGEDAYRGSGGPLTTVPSNYVDPLADAFLEAGETAGHGVTQDYNGARNEGVCRLQWTIRKGRRCSASVAYLRPALTRRNVTLKTRSLVHRVILEGKRAVGVEYSDGKEMKIARTTGEVILSGGVINSPQLLNLSGIGDPEELARHGIVCHHALKGVGKNLQDHLSVGVEYGRNGDGPFVDRLRYDAIAMAMAQAFFFGTGFATEIPGPISGFLKTDTSLVQPDIQLLVTFIPSESRPWFPGVRPRPCDAFMCRPVMLHPESRGEIKLRSSDPRDAPEIYQNFLSEPRDWETMRRGIEMTRDLVAQKSLDPFRGSEIQPGTAVRSKSEIDEYIRRTAWTAHHPLGTCRMGAIDDDMAVVDTELRVRGILGLRVVDASVMPDMVGGNINAPVIMIAERAADLIRGMAQKTNLSMNVRSDELGEKEAHHAG